MRLRFKVEESLLKPKLLVAMLEMRPVVFS